MKMLNKYIFVYLHLKARLFLFFGRDPVSGIKISKRKDLAKIGTGYGGWIVPKTVFKNNPICYCVGAGEDVTFDCELAEKYGGKVFIFDPTPRAKKHFKELVYRVKNPKKRKKGKKGVIFYDLSKKGLSGIKFLDYGISEASGKMKFFAPKNKKHVSYSVANLDKTESFIVAKFRRLSEVMREKKHKKLDLLKLDIEGAEYGVINSLIEDKLNIKVIAVEFDELRRPLDLWFRVLSNQGINLYRWIIYPTTLL
jgi:FkbM family methyltransferase